MLKILKNGMSLERCTRFGPKLPSLQKKQLPMFLTNPVYIKF